MEQKEYYIFVDIPGSFNINHGRYRTFALSKEEAIGKMVLNRPDLRNREIRTVFENDFINDIQKFKIKNSELCRVD